METIKVESIEELGIKRFYIPVQIPVNCPNCGEEAIIDLDTDYLSYPELNTKLDLYGLCEECDEGFTMDGYLRISLDIDKNSLKKE